jgi:small subunit ribosomal protein S17
MVVIGTKNIKELTGKVVSTKMQSTLVVEVSRAKTHPLYKKTFVAKKKYYVHCTDDQIQEGNVVRIRESKPISKLKRWTLVEVISSQVL